MGTASIHSPAALFLAASFAVPFGALLVLIAAPARAYDVSEDLRVYGHAQLWFTAHEQMEEAEELYQFPSRDAAATATTGFSLYRARVGADFYLLDRLLEFNTQVRLEKNVSLLDCYLGLHLAPWLSLYIGQFKIPAPAEALASTRDLDFIFRPDITEYLVDFSLSRTTYPSSLFYGVYNYLRDFGLGVKGEVDLGPGRLRWFFMAGNGLGANLFISGRASPGYILTNPGQLFTGLRVEAADFFGVLTVGGHLNYNWHDNMVFNSGRKVVDIKRIAYSGDATVRIPATGIRLGGLYGRGEIRDDYDDDGRTDLIYSGWECRLLWRINDPLAKLLPSPFWERHAFELGARFDTYTREWNQAGEQVIQRNWTFGLNYFFDRYVKVQINYVIKRTDDPSLYDLDDNILLLSVQGAV
jgi:hypothetical protein